MRTPHATRVSCSASHLVALVRMRLWTCLASASGKKGLTSST